MSFRREVVVRIDGGGDAAGIARRLADALVELNIVVDRRGPDLPYEPGPAAATVLEPGVQWADHEDNGVKIHTEPSMYHSFSNWARPNCDRCGARVGTDAVKAAFDTWLGATEPALSCQECGWSAPIGNWPAPWPFAFGAPAVAFENWPPLDPQFLGEVREALGGRTRVIRTFL
ncbi:hypothetical protein OWR29_34315 [Actinoplanes sp. Pm04-4]|uniref:Uncharacterized protein n=1 Tax=Paractinoplanes pyxinae TaxID=2997416 RepID=A0ABT4BBW8_9ACTN|nr:hypothetical protein [Actinoplanes pyxinae]MCY1143098.1 hypothetical protein [Actinoplanes pyxinae]